MMEMPKEQVQQGLIADILNQQANHPDPFGILECEPRDLNTDECAEVLFECVLGNPTR